MTERVLRQMRIFRSFPFTDFGTHASQLLFAGVSIASVARRFGHAGMTTTQKTYLHIIRELAIKDMDLVMSSLSGLT